MKRAMAMQGVAEKPTDGPAIPVPRVFTVKKQKKTSTIELPDKYMRYIGKRGEE